MEEYIVIALACLIKIYAFDVSTYYECISSLFAFSLLVITLVFPILAAKFLWAKHGSETLRNMTFKEKWGSLILDLQLRNKEALFFTTLFMVRRWLLALTIVALVPWNWA